MTDSRTLRLATIELDAALLERFVKYQEHVLATLSSSTEPSWAGRFAFAHAKALEVSGLDMGEQSRLRAMVANFCGRRSSLAAVRERTADLTRDGRSLSPKEELLLKRASHEIPKLADVADFEARYGKEAVDLLLAQESKLVELHRALTKLEGGGHVHERSAPN